MNVFGVPSALIGIYFDHCKNKVRCVCVGGGGFVDGCGVPSSEGIFGFYLCEYKLGLRLLTECFILFGAQLLIVNMVIQIGLP